MAKFVCYDFEVFKYDFLLGCIVIDGDGEHLFQSWNRQEITDFYKEHQSDIWIGWNSMDYDRHILQSVLKGQNPYLTSKNIVEKHETPYFFLPLYDFDLMRMFKTKVSLKLTELIKGDSIETTDVDFNLDRPLTDEEKQLTERYNGFDLKQTVYNFKKFYYNFELQIDIIKEFNLDLKTYLEATGTKLAAGALGAVKNPKLKYEKIEPIHYDNLQLKNKRLLDYYFNEEFRLPPSGETIKVGNAELVLGSGGLHYAQSKVHYDKLLYADISGAYNTVMIVYDLFSRSISEKGKELYKYMFKNEKALKKTNPKKRKVYKKILLSVYGAQMNENTDFSDPWKGLLVPITLQLFMIDLFEKIEDKVTFVQINTDGIMIKVNEPYTEEEVIAIINAWEERTGFQLKFEHLYNLWQRDVNNYVFQTEEGELEYRGEALKNYDISDAGYASGEIFDCKEPSIIAKGIIDYLIYGITPEETVEKYKHDLKNFQYACKKSSFDYLTYDIKYLNSQEVTSVDYGTICRAFAWNDKNAYGMVYKHKTGKSQKVSNLPQSVFVYNGEILSNEAYNMISPKIDFDYYVNRIYERMFKFVGLDDK